ncbi:MAG: hypothetical protein LRZ88_10350 [Candidatus Cloacimonetes bacterium]|nr:hypothetical protein [Candidatus Cloacimonadota bacterium]
MLRSWIDSIIFPLVFEFFRGIDVTKESNEAYKRYVDASFSLPNSLRNEESLKNLKNEDFIEIDEDFVSDGTIANDFVRVFKESDYGHNFKKIGIHKAQFIFKNTIGDKEVTNDIIVIRITTTGNKSYDFYVPREIIKTYGDQKIATYKVNNNEYMRVMIEGEDEKSLAYLDNISKAIEKDLSIEK